MNSRPIPYHLLKAAETRPSIAVRFKRHRSWLELSWAQYLQSAEAIGLSLHNSGIKSGDRVAILSNTRWEWAVCDFAIMGIGAVTVPIYQSYTAAEVEQIVLDSQAAFLFVEDEVQMQKWESIAKKCPHVSKVVCFQNWDPFIAAGTKLAEEHPGRFARLIQKVKPEDIATIVYTSGTTGEPKGAVLTHRQILSEVEDLAKVFPITANDSSLSFLPYAHVLGRIELWLHAFLGFTLNISDDIDRLRSDLRDVRPTVLLGVPRIFEKIYAGILTQSERSPWQRQVFRWLNGAENGPRKVLADTLIYSRVREGLGGRLRFAVSGGAPLEPAIAGFFNRAGVPLYEGYGLTETTGAITVNTPGAHVVGTVGRPLGDVKIKLDEDGEILIKSNKVMSGYFHKQEATDAVFKNGYFCTGDVGELTEQGFLRITDRKKDLIKTAGGKYVAPQKLEGLLKLDPLIGNVLIHGDRRKYIVALITLNETRIKELSQEHKWTFKDAKARAQSPEIYQLVRRIVAQVNSQLASYETIKNFAILPEDFTIASGELTPSLKVKRRICDERYKEVLDGLY